MSLRKSATVLDAVDEDIVRLLGKDGRLTHREIAAELGVSRSAAAARVQRLLGEGHVSVQGVVHPRVLGHGAVAHVSLAVRGPATLVARAVAGHEDVAFVSIATGRYAVIIELRVSDIGEVDEALARVRAIHGVEATETLLYSEILRDVAGPVGEATADLDDIDFAILRRLQDDGRSSYVQLAETVGLSAAQVRRRVLRLLDGNLVRVRAVLRHSGLDRRSATGVGIRLDGDHRDLTATLAQLSAVTFAARTLGRYDILLTVNHATPGALVQTLDQVHGLAGVRDVETWSHLEFVKESYSSQRLGASLGEL